MIIRSYTMHQIQAVLLLVWCMIGCVMIVSPNFFIKKWIAKAVLIIGCLWLGLKYLNPFNRRLILCLLELDSFIPIVVVMALVGSFERSKVLTWLIIKSIILILFFGLWLAVVRKSPHLTDMICLLGIIIIIVLLSMTKISKRIRVDTVSTLLITATTVMVCVLWPRQLGGSIMDPIIVLAEIAPMIYAIMMLRSDGSKWVSNRWVIATLMILPVFVFCSGIRFRQTA